MIDDDNNVVIVGSYQLERTVGQGTFSKVKVGVHLPTKSPVAIKILPKNTLEDSFAQERLRREIKAFSHCDHPFIAKFYDLIEDDDNLYMIQEYADGGNMLDSVNNRGSLTEAQVRRYFMQILSSLEYLHTHLHVMHRDLKAENVLLDQNDNVRLIDFGLCSILQDEAQIMKTACGSPAYAPPEMIQGRSYNHKVDTWSAGILLFAIADCQLPFDEPNVQRLLQKIVYTEPVYPAHFSEQLVDLLRQMLKKDPTQRLSITDIRAHPWVSDYILDEKIDEVMNMIDENEIKQKVIDLGFSAAELEEAIASKKSCDSYISYLIYRRQQMTKIMKDMFSPEAITNTVTRMLHPVFGPNAERNHTTAARRCSIVVPCKRSTGKSQVLKPNINIPIQKVSGRRQSVHELHVKKML